MIEIANKIQETLKNSGLSDKTKKICIRFFKEIKKHSKISPFKTMVITYLTDTLNEMKGVAKLLCTSDILESSFGKYKGYISDNISVGITDLALTIAAFTGTLDEHEIIKAMEHVKVRDIEEWNTANIGQTQTKKRRLALKVERRKKLHSP